MARLADHTGLFVPRRPADVTLHMLRRKKEKNPRIVKRESRICLASSSLHCPQ
jgi:hypothetical protein